MQIKAKISLETEKGRIARGEIVETEEVGIGDAEARSLIGRGFAEAVAASAASETDKGSNQAGGGNTAPTDPEERAKAIADAVELLEEGNEKHWTRDGRPDLSALAGVLGWKPTAAERDAVWEARGK